MDKSFFNELGALKARRKKRKLILIIAAALAIPLMAYGGLSGYNLVRGDNESPKAVAINQVESGDVTTNTEPEYSPQPQSETTQANLSIPSIQTDKDSATIAAELCSKYNKNHIESNARLIEMYFDGFKSWSSVYGTNPRSADAIEQKNFYINWFKSNHNQLVVELNSFQGGQCSKGLAETFLPSPDFSIWP